MANCENCSGSGTATKVEKQVVKQSNCKPCGGSGKKK